MIAASVPDSEAVIQVLLKAGADINAKSKSCHIHHTTCRPSSLSTSSHPSDNSGQTALHFVASKQYLDVAKLLIESKPPASTRVRDKRGQYPIHRAAAVGSVPIILLLLKNMSPLNATDNEGYTPLHHAIAEGHGMFFVNYSVTLTNPVGDTAVALLKEGADFTIKNAEDELPLDLAPDKEVRPLHPFSHTILTPKVRRYIEQGAEREGIDLTAQP